MWIGTLAALKLSNVATATATALMQNDSNVSQAFDYSTAHGSSTCTTYLCEFIEAHEIRRAESYKTNFLFFFLLPTNIRKSHTIRTRLSADCHSIIARDGYKRLGFSADASSRRSDTRGVRLHVHRVFATYSFYVVFLFIPSVRFYERYFMHAAACNVIPGASSDAARRLRYGAQAEQAWALTRVTIYVRSVHFCAD